MTLWIAPDAVFDGTDLHQGLGLRIDGQTVVEVGPAPERAVALSGTITPGFVDLQVNGGGGVMINSTPTPDGLRAVAAAHRALGTSAILPTVITDHADVLDAAADAAIATHGKDGIIGLHIEGPHISHARRGTHASEFIRPMDKRTIDCVRRLRGAGVPVMITVAPENTTAAQISQISATGAIVSLGHTDATAETIETCITAGAGCGTHLFNAMSAMVARAPGAVGALINSQCYTGIICDGHHVADEMVALAIRARPQPNRIFLVSDSMATVGGPDEFELYGKTIRVKNGQLVNEEGSLAGAHITQAQGVARLVNHADVPLDVALRMAVTTPATCIGRPDLATLVERDIRNVILLSPDLTYLGDLSTRLPATSNAAK